MSATVIGGRSAAQTSKQTRAARAARAEKVIEELTAQRIALCSALLDDATAAPVGERAEAHELHHRQNALIAARLAAWWGVLARLSWFEVPEVFVRAAYNSSYAERDCAHKARERARYWAERAAGVEGSSGVSR